MSHSGMTPGEAAAYKEYLASDKEREARDEQMRRLTRECIHGAWKEGLYWPERRKPLPDELILSLALERLATRGFVPPCEVRIAEVPGSLAHIVKGAIEVDPKALHGPIAQLDHALEHAIVWANDWPMFWKNDTDQ